MSGSTADHKSSLERVKALPWAVLLQIATVIGARWWALSERDRARIARLVRESRGWPANLSPKERKELRGLLAKFDLKGIGGELLPLARGRGARRKRR